MFLETAAKELENNGDAGLKEKRSPLLDSFRGRFLSGRHVGGNNEHQSAERVEQCRRQDSCQYINHSDAYRSATNF